MLKIPGVYNKYGAKRHHNFSLRPIGAYAPVGQFSLRPIGAYAPVGQFSLRPIGAYALVGHFSAL
jgi:hypothetical protein